MQKANMFVLLFCLIFHCFSSFSQEKASVRYSIFAPGVISLPGIKEGSPSFTADGKTLMFTRYQSYPKQVPYIAFKKDNSWEVKRWEVVDTVYNLAISPDGKRVVYKVKQGPDSEAPFATFRVDQKEDGHWAEPIPMKPDLMKNAGYFRIAQDGNLYMYINSMAGNPKGIYLSRLLPDGSYTSPQWLSDAVSPYGSTTYTPIPNTAQNKLIVNRAGIYLPSQEEKLGSPGLYLHQKFQGHWDTGVQIKGIPYTFYAAMTSDDRMIFLYKTDFYEIDVKDLNISFSPRSRISKIESSLSEMEAAYRGREINQLSLYYDKSAEIYEGGKEKAQAVFAIRRFWKNKDRQPIALKFTPLITSQDTTKIYHSKIWKDLEVKPSKIHVLDAPLAEHGFYQLLNVELTFREEGLEKTEQQTALFHWTEQWGEALILVDSRI